MKAIRIVLCVSLLMMTSCSSLVYIPKPPLLSTTFSTAYLSDLSTPTMIKDFNAMPEGPAKIARRNEIVWEIVYLTDSSYRTYESGFFSGQAYVGTAGDIAVLSLDAVAAVTGTAHLKAVLAAISGGVTGVRASYQKNFYDQASRDSIVQTMRANRLAQLAVIQQGMRTGSNYTIEQALLDATDYYDAGTVIGALITINTSASQVSTTARRSLGRMQ